MPYTATMPLILVLRVAIHESASQADAPRYATYLFFAWITYVYAASAWSMYHTSRPPQLALCATELMAEGGRRLGLSEANVPWEATTCFGGGSDGGSGVGMMLVAATETALNGDITAAVAPEEVPRLAEHVAEATLDDVPHLDVRRLAYLLELPNALLMGWGYVGLRFFGSLQRPLYGIFSLASPRRASNCAVGTYPCDTTLAPSPYLLS